MRVCQVEFRVLHLYPCAAASVAAVKSLTWYEYYGHGVNTPFSLYIVQPEDSVVFPAQETTIKGNVYFRAGKRYVFS